MTTSTETNLYLKMVTSYCTNNEREQINTKNFLKAFFIFKQGGRYLKTIEKAIFGMNKAEIWNTMTNDNYIDLKRQLSILNNSLNCLKTRQSFIIFRFVFKFHSKIIFNLIEEFENILENYEIRNSEFFKSFHNIVQTNNYQLSYSC